MPGVDPARIALFGTSLSGGHVLVAAARDGKPAEHLEFLRRVLPVELDSAQVPRAEASRTGL